MIPLTNRSSATTQTLVITLAGAATTTYPTCTVSSYIVPPQTKPDFAEYRSAPEFTLLTAATETTIATAPPEGSVKDIHNIVIYNADTVAATVLIAIDDNGTNRNLVRVTLATLETLYYEDKRGWYVTTASGAEKINAGIATISSSTDNAFVRWDGASGTLVQNSSATLDDNGRPTFPTTVGVGNATPSTSGSGVTFPASQSASTDANTLDDYEKGSWTPANPQVSLTSVSGDYIKIGDQVFIRGRATFPASADTNSATWTGLPFTAAANAYPIYVSSNQGTYVQGTIGASTATINNFQNPAGPVTLTNATIATATVTVGAVYSV